MQWSSRGFGGAIAALAVVSLYACHSPSIQVTPDGRAPINATGAASDAEEKLRRVVESQLEHHRSTWGVPVPDLERPLFLWNAQVNAIDLFVDDGGTTHLRHLTRVPVFEQASANCPVEEFTVGQIAARSTTTTPQKNQNNGVVILTLPVRPLVGTPEQYLAGPGGLMSPRWLTSWFWQPSGWPPCSMSTLLTPVASSKSINLAADVPVYVLAGDFEVSLNTAAGNADLSEGLLRGLVFWQLNGLWGVSPDAACHNVLALPPATEFLWGAGCFRVTATSQRGLELSVSYVGSDLSWQSRR